MSGSDCVVRQIQSNRYLSGLEETGSDTDLPLAGSIELTLRCNLRCRHCYIRYAGATDAELPTRDLLVVLDKLADAGVLFLLMTGGEVLVRSDFAEIYRHAKNLGFLISLYTNATLVTDAIADLLVTYRPRRVEVTAYGQTAEVYGDVTQSSHGFERFRNGVQLLVDRRLPVRIKAMVLRSNRQEFEGIRRWAETEMGLPFRFDGIVNPRLNGDCDVLEERIDPREVARLVHGSDDETDRLERLQQVAVQSGPDERLFRCGAGIRTVHVDPQGRMHPCMMWRATPYDFLHGDVRGWKRHVAQLRSRKMPAGSPCSTCRSRLACGNCPATSLLETGVAGLNPDYYCRIVRERVDYKSSREGIAAAERPISVDQDAERTPHET